MSTLLASITVWYLVVGIGSDGRAVIPSPFMSKEECLEAGQEVWETDGDAPGESYSRYICVKGVLYD